MINNVEFWKLGSYLWCYLFGYKRIIGRVGQRTRAELNTGKIVKTLIATTLALKHTLIAVCM